MEAMLVSMKASHEGAGSRGATSMLGQDRLLEKDLDSSEKPILDVDFACIQMSTRFETQTYLPLFNTQTWFKFLFDKKSPLNLDLSPFLKLAYITMMHANKTGMYALLRRLGFSRDDARGLAHSTGVPRV